MVAHLAGSNVVHVRFGVPHAWARKFAVKVDAIEPPPVQGSAKSERLMGSQETAVLGLVEPSHLRKQLFPPQDKSAMLQNAAEIILCQHGCFLRQLRKRSCPVTFVYTGEAIAGNLSRSLGKGSVFRQREPGISNKALEDDTAWPIQAVLDVDIINRRCIDLEELVEWTEISLKDWKKDSGLSPKVEIEERPVDYRKLEDGTNVQVVIDLEQDLDWHACQTSSLPLRVPHLESWVAVHRRSA